MEGREQRGLEIAARLRVRERNGAWEVPSQSFNRRLYRVDMAGEASKCSCPDHRELGVKCKHIFAVEYTVEREEHGDGTATVTETMQVTETVKRTYPQDWPAYNAAQVNEKALFQSLLFDLCQDIEEPPPGKGRPRIPVADAVFSATFKVYSTLSGRRFMSDLRDAHGKGYVSRVPCYNSIFNILESEATTPILQALVVRSARPLQSLETHFSCDSSGFSGSRFDRWYDHKHRRQTITRAWVKAHVMTGAKTNVVTAIEIHGKNAFDGNLLPPLLNTTLDQGFNVEELSADLAYSSLNNLQVTTDAGIDPYIPFKRNATPGRGGIWAKMFHYYNLHREEFLGRYHLRSNVESTFSMVKAKFGDGVRSKSDQAMVNEVMAKFLCHNICCVIQSMYEMGVEPEFCQGIEPRSH